MPPVHCRWLFVIAVAVGGAAAAERQPLRASEPDEVGFLMFEDPSLEFSPPSEQPRETSVALDDLASDQPRTRLQTARLLLSDITAGVLVPPETADHVASALKESPRHSAFQQALVSTLLALDAEEHAETLWSVAEEDLSVAPAVEPALRRWESDVAVSDWRSRLEDSETPPDDVVRAIKGLAVVGTRADVPSMVQRLDPVRAPVVTVTAARALAELRPEENVELARRLLQRGRGANQPHAWLAAALLLVGDGSNAAREVLLAILSEGGDAAANIALRALHRHHPEVALEQARRWAQHGGTRLRETAIEILGAAPRGANVPALVGALDDRERRLRRVARRHLLEAASDPQLRPVVIETLQEPMRDGSWRSVEQAILLLAALDQRQIVPELMEYLEHPRGDVSVTAAWGLRVLVDDPDTVDRVAERVDQWTRQPGPALAESQAERHEVHRLAHLLELLGKHRHRPSDDVLRRLVPKGSGFDPVPRAAAFWALGKLWQSDAPPELVQQMRERMLDMNAEYPEVPEDERVGYAAIITLGRIAGSELVEDIAIFDHADLEAPPIGAAARWAIEQIRQREGSQSAAR